MSTLANSSVGNTIFTTSGIAISTSNQPQNKKATVIGGNFSSDTANAIGPAAVEPKSHANTSVRSALPVAAPSTGNQLAALTKLYSNPAGSPNLTASFEVNDALVGIDTDDYVYISGYVFKITTKTLNGNDPTDIIVSCPSTAAQNAVVAASSAVFIKKENIGKVQNINMISGYSSRIANSTNDAIQGAAGEPNRGVNEFEAIRTTRTATAIRAGHWNESTGSWTVNPTTADDTSIIGSDTANSGNGTVTYGGTSGTPTNSVL